MRKALSSRSLADANNFELEAVEILNAHFVIMRDQAESVARLRREIVFLVEDEKGKKTTKFSTIVTMICRLMKATDDRLVIIMRLAGIPMPPARKSLKRPTNFPVLDMIGDQPDASVSVPKVSANGHTGESDSNPGPPIEAFPEAIEA